MKSWLLVPLLLASYLADGAIAQSSQGCTSYWINPRTQKEECFDGNLSPTPPPLTPPTPGRAAPTPSRPTVREDSNREPINYLNLIREAQSTYMQRFGRFAGKIQDLDRALRAGQLRPAFADANSPLQIFKAIPGATSSYRYQIQPVTSLQRQNQLYLVYWIGATARNADRYSYVTVLLSTAEKSSRSDTYVFCKSQAPNAKIPGGFLATSSQDLAALIQQSEALQAKFTANLTTGSANLSQAEQEKMGTQALQEMEQLMQRFMAVLQCPPGFQEVKT